LASSSANASPVITLVDPGVTDTLHKVVLADDEEVGHIIKATHGQGYFLTLDGVTWNNAPGARYTADAGGGAPSTFVKSLRMAINRVERHYADKHEALANAAASR